MKHVTHLECLICGRKYPPGEVDYVCPRHGNQGILEVAYDYERIRHRVNRSGGLGSNMDRSMWRYKHLMPMDPDSPLPPLQVGWTPLQPLTSLQDRMGLRNVFLKDDGRQPTASFKDRASALAVVKAGELGAEIIATASSGNAAAALSGICASLQRANLIFVPQSAPQAKITQLLVYGSTVLLVEGSYDQAFDLCLQAAAEYGWYNRSTGFNPYMSEGKKTAAYEICEQLNWQAPDAVLVSVGDGCIIGGLHKGFRDLKALGWIQQIPRLIGVQASGSDFLVQAWENNEDVLAKPPLVARTVADSISVGLPRDRIKAMAAVRQSGGAFIRVSDERILQAIPDLARCSGVFAEPAGAAAFAGLGKALELGLVGKKERIVVVNTGNGLKDIPSAMRAVEAAGGKAHRVEAGIESVRRVVSRNDAKDAKANDRFDDSRSGGVGSGC